MFSIRGVFNKKQKYEGTQYSEQTREVVGALFAARKEAKISTRDFMTMMRVAGVTIPQRSLERYATAIGSQSHVFSPEKNSGRPSILNPQDVQLIVGYALHHNKKNKIVNYHNIKTFVQDKLSIQCDESTIKKILNGNGFVGRMASNRTIGYQQDDDQLAEELARWILEIRDSGVLDVSRYKLCSIDFTYTGHRTDRVTTIAMKGR